MYAPGASATLGMGHERTHQALLQCWALPYVLDLVRLYPLRLVVHALLANREEPLNVGVVHLEFAIVAVPVLVNVRDVVAWKNHTQIVCFRVYWRKNI